MKISYPDKEDIEIAKQRGVSPGGQYIYSRTKKPYWLVCRRSAERELDGRLYCVDECGNG